MEKPRGLATEAKAGVTPDSLRGNWRSAFATMKGMEHGFQLQGRLSLGFDTTRAAWIQKRGRHTVVSREQTGSQHEKGGEQTGRTGSE